MLVRANTFTHGTEESAPKVTLTDTHLLSKMTVASALNINPGISALSVNKICQESQTSSD
jgi:hypothetical protein